MKIIDLFLTLTDIELSDAAIYSILAIVLVFLILIIIIGVTSLIFKFIAMLKDRSGQVFNKNKKSKNANDETRITKLEDISDEEMMAAVLTASIIYQEETKKHIKLIGVKEIK